MNDLRFFRLERSSESVRVVSVETTFTRSARVQTNTLYF
jgi:hypothetical protein